MKSLTFWIGLISGGVAGAALGLLFAPSRGQVTRGQVSRAASSARHKAIAPWQGHDRMREDADVIRQSI